MFKFASALLTGLALTYAAITTTASAEDSRRPGGWTFEISPYIWLSGISGDIDIPTRLGGSASVGVDAKFTDLVENLSAIPFMAMAEARYGRLTLMGDILYLQIESEAETRSSAFGGAESRIGTTIGSLAATYRVVDERWHTLEFGAGFRVWSVSTRLALEPGTLPGGVAKTSKTWFDPILAGRYRARLSDDFSLSLYGDIGGFGVGSEIAWQVLGTVDYAATSWLDLKLGYRYLALEYDGDRARFDLNFHGPFVAATFKF